MDELLGSLPRVYAQFLALQRDGASDSAIAEQLGIPIESLPLLARLARAKLARLQSTAGHTDATPTANPSHPEPDTPQAGT